MWATSKSGYGCWASAKGLVRFLTQDLSARPVFATFNNNSLSHWLFRYFAPGFSKPSNINFVVPQDGIGRPYKVLTFERQDQPHQRIHLFVETLGDDEMGILHLPADKSRLVMQMDDRYPWDYRELRKAFDMLQSTLQRRPEILEKLRAKKAPIPTIPPMRPAKLKVLSRPYAPYIHKPNVTGNKFPFSQDNLAFITAMVFEDLEHPEQNRWVYFPVTIHDPKIRDPEALVVKFHPEEQISPEEAAFIRGIMGGLKKSVHIQVSRGEGHRQSILHRIGQTGFVEDGLSQTVYRLKQDPDRRHRLGELQDVTVTQVASTDFSHILGALRPSTIPPKGHAHTAQVKVAYTRSSAQETLDIDFSAFHKGIPWYQVEIQTRVIDAKQYQMIRAKLVSLVREGRLDFENVRQEVIDVINQQHWIALNVQIYRFDNTTHRLSSETFEVNFEYKQASREVNNPMEMVLRDRGVVEVHHFDPEKIMTSASPFSEIHIVDQSPRHHGAASKESAEAFTAGLGLPETAEQFASGYEGWLTGLGYIHSRVAYQALTREFPQLASESSDPFEQWMSSTLRPFFEEK